jgi:DNA-binding HxlR family transcriptional regulator/putative sterol carrier protein
VSRRGYRQYCATARTLDLLGERWTLLIVRELLTGPRRFKDLADSLPGVGTGLLTARLKHLEAAGVLRRTRLRRPADAPAYELTPAGRELEPAIVALARWGLRWALGERGPDDVFRPAWAVLGLRALFSPAAAAGVRTIYELRVGGETFHVRVEDGEIEVGDGPAQRPDAMIEAGEEAFTELALGRLALDEAVRAGRARTEGDRATLARLRRLFPVPAAPGGG